MSANILPDQFKDLTGFVADWALPSQVERIRKRRASSIEEIQAFYAGILPRMEHIISYLNEFKSGEMPEENARLLNLALSFIEVSPAVELFHEPDETGTFDSDRLTIQE